MQHRAIPQLDAWLGIGKTFLTRRLEPHGNGSQERLQELSFEGLASCNLVLAIILL